MSGREDQDTHDFFIGSAFPSEDQVNEILKVLAHRDGLSVYDITEQINLRHRQIEKVLKQLSVEAPALVIKVDSRWRRIPLPYVMDHARITHLTNQREQEWAEVKDYLADLGCKMAFLRRALDDNDPPVLCGKYAFCLGQLVVDVPIDTVLAHQAATSLKHVERMIQPKV